jgi:hypothetical protein
LKLQYDEPLLDFAFNFNLSRYREVGRELAASARAAAAAVGCCNFKVSESRVESAWF